MEQKEILNELYFGKNMMTDFLDSTFECLKELLQDKNYNSTNGQYLLSNLFKQFYPFITKYEAMRRNFMNRNSYTYVKQLENEKYIKSLIVDEKIIINSHKNLNRIKNIISWMFKMIFGYHEVYIIFIDEKDLNHTFPLTVPLIYKIPPFKQNPINLPQPNEILIVEDDFNRKLDYDAVVKAIDVQKTGMRIRWEHYALSMVLAIPIGVIKNVFTYKEAVAVFLHEIGHTFSKLLTPHANIRIKSRQDEKFADKFVTLYGYGEESISALSKVEASSHLSGYIQVHNYFTNTKDMADFIYKGYYKTRKIGLSDAQTKKYLHDLSLKYTDLKRQYNNAKTIKEKNEIGIKLKKIGLVIEDVKRKKIDEHPLYYLRMINQIDQLKIELKNKHNNEEDKEKILNDLKKIKNQIKKYKESNMDDPFYEIFGDDFAKMNTEIKNMLMNDIKNMKMERKEEHNNKLHSKLVSSLLDNMYDKSNKENLITEKFKQFIQVYFNNKSTKYECSKLFEEFLVLKYPKRSDETIEDYAKHIIWSKLNELAFNFDNYLKNVVNFMQNDTIHDPIDLNNNIYYIIKNDSFSGKYLTSKDFSKISQFKIFVSDCTFNSYDTISSVNYDPDELERIEKLCRKYYF